MTAPIPFAAIREAALPHLESLCRRWLPTGTRGGSWWLARCPWREDRNPSLGVSLTSGRWKDFATGESGDVIDLYGRIFGVDAVTAASDVAQIVGHPFREARRA